MKVQIKHNSVYSCLLEKALCIIFVCWSNVTVYTVKLLGKTSENTSMSAVSQSLHVHNQ